jgi:hypothetical protein
MAGVPNWDEPSIRANAYLLVSLVTVFIALAIFTFSSFGKFLRQIEHR